MKARDLAQGKWPAILASLGVDGKVLDGKHHPCPNGGEGTDRFRFADRNGSGNFFCTCSEGDKGGLALLMCCKGWSYAEACREVERVAGHAQPAPAKERQDPRGRLNRIREKARAAGPAVREYLAARGLECPPTLKQVREKYYQDRGDCRGEFDVMVALVVGPDGKPETYHRTFLDGARKAAVPSPRKVLTPVRTINGGAVRLYRAGPHLGVAEGIETAIAAHMISGLPVWSVLNANGLETFVPPTGTERVTIFADNDSSYVGQAAAYECARRLAAPPFRLQCDVRIPDHPDTDWNDELLGRERAA
ncbi:DUF7146 domain-containing protein [Luteibacter sp. NPDC031894]|uniref:DUF7146 domain-containing protein n=1 Tax=Luteibacter sp. NPDC031894 TaxID=3390572 RepID=UPI003D0633D8